MRLVFAGTPAAAVPSLEALLASRHEVVAVLTRPDAPAGRGRRLTGSAVAERARAAGLPLLQPASARDPQLQAELERLAPDCCPVVAYGALVPRALLDLPREGWVNLHFSLLPAWRGAAPVQHAVFAGDEVTGASAFRLEEGLDTGPVLGTMTTAIGPRETAGELLGRLARDGAGLLVSVLDGLEEGRLDAVAQPSDGVSHAPKLMPDDARVDWSAPALRVDRLLRACTPEPGGWTTLRGERLGLGPVEPLEADPLTPGELVVRPREVLVGTGTSPVRLGEVRPAGRRPMAAADWARGARLAAGEWLGG